MPKSDTQSFMNPNGIWVSSAVRRHTGQAALFLDRDGVLVEEKEYLRKPEDVCLTPGAIDLIVWAKSRDIPVIVVSNQSGIARQLMGWAEFEAVEREIARQLGAASPDLIIACPFHPGYTTDYGIQHAHWRKPGPGMLHLAGEMLGIDMPKSWLIGDKASDIEAAKTAGLGGAIHVLTGHGIEERPAAIALEDSTFRVLSASGLIEAAELLKSSNLPEGSPS